MVTFIDVWHFITFEFYSFCLFSVNDKQIFCDKDDKSKKFGCLIIFSLMLLSTKNEKVGNKAAKRCQILLHLSFIPFACSASMTNKFFVIRMIKVKSSDASSFFL